MDTALIFLDVDMSQNWVVDWLFSYPFLCMFDYLQIQQFFNKGFVNHEPVISPQSTSLFLGAHGWSDPYACPGWCLQLAGGGRVEQLSKGAGGLEVIFTGWFSANLHWILQWTSLLNLWSLRSLPCLHPLHFLNASWRLLKTTAWLWLRFAILSKFAPNDQHFFGAELTSSQAWDYPTVSSDEGRRWAEWRIVWFFPRRTSAFAIEHELFVPSIGMSFPKTKSNMYFIAFCYRRRAWGA